MGILDEHIPGGTTYKGVKVLGTLGNLEYILPENKLDEIAITLSLKDYDYLKVWWISVRNPGAHQIHSGLQQSDPQQTLYGGSDGITGDQYPVCTADEHRQYGDQAGNGYRWFHFRYHYYLTDHAHISNSGKAVQPGPVIFKQERVGLHNKPFYMYKFRSMAMQTAAEEKKGWTVRNDPRVTGIGKILRRTSIDELPQLFNILKGDMSLVGPRPERPQFVEKFKEEIPRYMVKHQVRPGLTGWAQVNGLRGDSSIKKRIEYDIYYIENWTIGFDIKIILMTFFTGFINKNAY